VGLVRKAAAVACVRHLPAEVRKPVQLKGSDYVHLQCPALSASSAMIGKL